MMPPKTPVKKKADKKPTKKPAKKPAGAIKKMTQKQTNTQVVNVSVNTPNAPKQTRRKRASKPPAPDMSLGDYSRARVSAFREQVPPSTSYITPQGDIMTPLSKLLGGIKHHPTENLTPAEMRDSWANRFADLSSLHTKGQDANVENASQSGQSSGHLSEQSSGSSGSSSSSRSLPDIEIESDVPPPTGHTEPVLSGNDKLTVADKRAIRDFYGVQNVADLKNIVGLNQYTSAEETYKEASKRSVQNWYKRVQVKKA